MPYWSAVAAVGGNLIGGLLSKEGQSGANRMNLQIWREQRDWQTQMANTEVQRRTADMKAAGINPMLSVMGGGAASTPSVGMPRMENENAALGEGVSRGVSSAIQAAQLKLLDSQIDVQKAQARKTNAEAGAIEPGLQYSAGTAKMNYETLMTNFDKLTYETEVALAKRDMTNVEKEELQPLVIELQRLLVQAEKLGMSEREAVSKLYEKFSAAKGIERFLPMILSIVRESRR